MEFLSILTRYLKGASLVVSYVVACGVVMCLPVHANEPEALDESQILAQMIMNFPLVTVWPDNAKAEDNRITICAMHESPVSNDVAALINASRAAAQYRFMVNVSDEQLMKCHVLIVSERDMGRMSSLRSQLSHQPVLTVGMSKHFIEKGGMIGFLRTEKNLGVFSEQTIRFEINLAHAQRAGLILDPLLLELAERIVTE
jgi:hypothetical protein